MGSPKPYRPAADQKPAPPPPLPGTDELDRTARQVRVDGSPEYDHPSTVHRLRGQPYTVAELGRHYRIMCGGTLTAFEGAILTTREATCGRCLAGGGVRA